MTFILKGVATRGTGKLRDLKVPIAGKTGTTNNNFDLGLSVIIQT